MKGAFQISREIFQNDIWNDPVKFRIFFYIIGNAVFSHDGIEHAGMHLQRGQFLRSLRNLQDDLSYREGRGNSLKKYPLTTIQRKLKSLVKDGQITMKRTEYGTLFTVVNYATYQSFEHYKKESVEQKRNSDGTVTEQRWNNNKNVKECSNKEKEISSSRGSENPFEFYQQNIGVLKPHVSESIGLWCDDLSDEIVIAALKITVKNNANSFSYTESILREWANSGLKTVEDIRAYEMDKKDKKQKQNQKQNKPQSIPTWKQAQEVPKPKWMDNNQTHEDFEDKELQAAKEEAAKVKALLEEKRKKRSG
ncbi:DnaD domain-containing protein [Salipaludibacillus agaradhaerens]|uniref:DnaD domain-containing protein n=1 Tax=Salipaludibacillus agaradhaerens TaxID=76935 RepID=UPI0009975491|nr:DnaD domain protein [Salipaludibacillus agaradhaerens]